jgi:flagellar biosynthesis component FlhA
VSAIVLDPASEAFFRDGASHPSVAQRLLSSLNDAATAFANVSTPPLVLCAADIRPSVADFFGRRVPGLAVASFSEMDPKTTVRTLAMVQG